MPKFRKKPVVIEAWHFDGSWASAAPIVALDGKIVWSSTAESGVIHIETLEGTMEASPGDYVIRGVKGEVYPCKPDIFAATYDEVIERTERPSIDELEKILQEPADPTVRINMDGSVTRAVR